MTGYRTHNLGMCPDQGLNPQPFLGGRGVYGPMLQPTEPPGQGNLGTLKDLFVKITFPKWVYIKQDHSLVAVIHIFIRFHTAQAAETVILRYTLNPLSKSESASCAGD